MKRTPGIREEGAGRSLIVVLTALLGVFALATAAIATHLDFDISIPVDTVVFADEGSETLLAQVDVPEDPQGLVCEVEAESRNQSSVHPGNDLAVRSGTSEVILADVEAESAGTVTGSGPLELGPTITVWLLMGPDEVFSAGIDVLVDCDAALTTTTTTDDDDDDDDDKATTTTTTIPFDVAPTTISDEVLPTEVTPSTLPFTGAFGENLALIALVLVGVGLLFLDLTRMLKREEE